MPHSLFQLPPGDSARVKFMNFYVRWQLRGVRLDDLTAFAWSAPMRELAAKVGMSDVGLRKMLRSHGVVLPMQGHWNKVRAGGKVPPPPKAPARRPGQTGRVLIDPRLIPFVPEAKPIPACGPFATKFVPEELGELREQELKAIGRVAVPRTLDRHHNGLKEVLKKEQRRREKPYDEPNFDGPLWQRRFRLINAIFIALSKRDCRGDVYEQNQDFYARVVIGDTSVSIELEIDGKFRKTMRWGRLIPAPDLPASTPLVLRIKGAASDPFEREWRDDADGPLEKKVGQIAAELIVAGEAIFRKCLAENELEAERKRIEQKAKDERERIEQEERRLARIKALNDERVANLHRSGELLRLAADLRCLVAQVRSASVIGERMDSATLAKWEAWALEEADRIDPVLSGQIFSHISPPAFD